VLLQRELRVSVAAASSIARRLASSPCAMRPRRAEAHTSTSACSSMSSGRPPSRVTVTMLPAAGCGERDRKNSGGVSDLLQSTRAHGKEAQLVHRAKAFLVARTMR